MIKYSELGWTKVEAGRYKKDLNGRVLEIQKGLLDEWWNLYLDGERCHTSSGAPASYGSFEQAVNASYRIGPCKDCGKIYSTMLHYSDNAYCRCTKCVRFHAELHIGYSEGARMVRRIDNLWAEVDKVRAATSTRHAVELYLAGDI